MEVILLERVAKLGQMGEVVRVKDGFARNFLLPKGKALRATKDNKAKFEGMKVELEAQNLEAKGEADKIGRQAQRQELPGAAPGLRNRPAVRLGVAARHRRRCSTDERLRRSTATRSRSTRRSRRSASTRCRSQLHPEVEVTITVNVARSADEAERLARGENVTVRREGGADEEEAAGGRGRGGSFFEPGAGEADEARRGRRSRGEGTPRKPAKA